MSVAPAVPRGRRLLFGGVAILLAVLFAVCTGEGVARLLVGDRVVFNRLDRWEPHTKLGRILRADHEFEAEGVHYATNALHLRDRTYAPEPPAGVRRVLVVGDSFVYGIGPLETIFPKVAESALGAETELGASVEVMTAGLPGFGTIQQNLYLAEFLRGYRFDLLVLAFCVGNDIQENERFAKREHLTDRARRDDGPGDAETGLLEHSKLYQIYRERRRLARKSDTDRFEEFVEERMELADPAYYAPGTSGAAAYERTLVEIARMADFARERGARTVVVLLPEEYQLVDPLWTAVAARKGWADDQGVRQLVQQKITAGVAALGRDDVRVVDPTPYFTGERGATPAVEAAGASDGYYLPRDTHFNVRGNAVMARSLVDLVTEEFAGERRR